MKVTLALLLLRRRQPGRLNQGTRGERGRVGGAVEVEVLKRHFVRSLQVQLWF